jgi:hypothetical protein
MEKQKESALEKFLSGTLDMSDRKEKNNLYLDIAEGLSSPKKEDNAAAVSGLIKYKEKTGEQPEIYSPSAGTPPRCLSQDIREGLIQPTEEAERMFSSTQGSPLPGKGDRDEQELLHEDLEIAFEAAGFQTGQKIGSQDRMAIDEGKGQYGPEQGDPVFRQENQDMTFGATKMLKGMLTGDPEEIQKGAKEWLECPDNRAKDLFDKAGEFMKNPSLETAGKLMGGIAKEGNAMSALGSGKSPFELNLGDLAKSHPAAKLAGAVADVLSNPSGAAEKVMKNLEEALSPFQKPGAKKEEAPESEDKKKGPENAMGEEGFDMKALAAAVAAASTYKKARSKGMNPKGAGEMASVAGDEAGLTYKGLGDNKEGEKNIVDAAKAGKNMASGLAAKAAPLILPPPMGKAVAAGIMIADKATDFILDAVKAAAPGKNPMDQLTMEKVQESGGPAPKEQVETPGGLGEGKGHNLEGFKETMSKGKSGILKKVLPMGGDQLEGMAVSALESGAKNFWDASKGKGKKDPTADSVPEGMHQPM